LGKDEKALKAFEFTPDKFRRFEGDLETVNKIQEYGNLLATL
jgi:hypothetical protein